MSSVTKRIDEIKQPPKGYIGKYLCNEIKITDNYKLHENENIHGSIIGTVVDYLTRFSFCSSVNHAFRIPLIGSMIAVEYGLKSAVKDAIEYADNIQGLDDESIYSACKLVEFDSWARNPIGAFFAAFRDPNYAPNNETIENIRILVNRCRNFFTQNGPIIKEGFSFGPSDDTEEKYKQFKKEKNGNYGGYTPIVDSGDGDFLTTDTLWDLKVLKGSIKSKERLQVVMYWIMGQHSGQEIFKNIDKVGLYNPRKNIAYVIEISKIPKSIIRQIEDKVLCYNERIPSPSDYDIFNDIQIKLPD